MLLTYFLIQLILRIAISDSTDLDESEQLVLTQQLHWGYGPQPPLYTWIQLGLFRLFGLSIFSLALFKNVLLCSTYVLAYLNARIITRSPLCGIAAAASLFFVPQIAWESQRDLTHSVLASTLVMITWCALFQIQSHSRMVAYIALGIAMGTGILSKYNYVIFLVALIVALFSFKEFRGLLLCNKMLVAGAIALVIVSPNVLWMMQHRDLALSTSSKFAISDSGARLLGVLSGFASVLKSIITFLGPSVVILTVIFYRKSEILPQVKSPFARLMRRTLVISFFLIAGAVVISGATDIRDRWLQPLLVYTPVLIITALEEWLDPRRLKKILILAGLVMLLVPTLLAGRILLAKQLHRKQPFNEPYKELAAQMRNSLRGIRLIVVDSKLLGGNLRLSMPDKLFVTPELVPIFAPEPTRCGFAWNTTKQMEPPKALIEFGKQMGFNLTNASPEYFVANYKFGDPRQTRLGVIAP